MSETTTGGIDMLTSDFIDKIDKWQQANDDRYEQMRGKHNELVRLYDRHVDTYNKHIYEHGREGKRLDHVAHIVDHNARETRLHQALIIGAIALAAFALGRNT